MPYLVCRLLLEKNFFNDTATTEIYTLSLHDALPIWALAAAAGSRPLALSDFGGERAQAARAAREDEIGRAHV